MVVSKNELVHIIIRRLFEKDLMRHFAGTIQDTAECLIRVTGYAFVFDQNTGNFVRRAGKRTLVFSLSDAGLIVSILPDSVDLDNLHYVINENGWRILTDDRDFRVNVSEFSVSI